MNGVQHAIANKQLAWHVLVCLRRKLTNLRILRRLQAT